MAPAHLSNIHCLPPAQDMRLSLIFKPAMPFPLPTQHMPACSLLFTTPELSSQRPPVAFPPQQSKALLALLSALTGPGSCFSNKLGVTRPTNFRTLEGTLSAILPCLRTIHSAEHLESTQMCVGRMTLTFNELL